jgi:predicted signal transduction protein with EAL and GGDEF domain
MFRRCLAGERVVFEVDTETIVGKKTLQIDYIPDSTPDGAIAGFYTLGSDVSELKDAQRQLGLLVRSDSLTGLANRYQFNETLPLALARCDRSGRAMAVMFLEVDHFKQVNDTLGHAAGDTILKEFARRLQQNIDCGGRCRLAGAGRRRALQGQGDWEKYLLPLEGLIWTLMRWRGGGSPPLFI